MNSTALKPTWIAADWGTTHLRLWAMAADGQTLANKHSTAGMGKLQAHQYEGVLLGLVSEWLSEGDCLPVLICGAAGARQGWQEAPYMSLPLTLPYPAQPIRVTTADPRIAVHILPGLKQLDPPDVMRGEETQIAGFCAENPTFSGVLVLPGTHSKWVQIHASRVQATATCLSGELFQLLAEQSLLRHSVGSHEAGHDGVQAEFETAFLMALEQPAGFSERLFAIRAAHLLNNTPAAIARAHLSANVLALEMAAMRERFLRIRPAIALIGSPTLVTLYAQALHLAGYPASQHSGDTLVLAGLRAAYQTLKASGGMA